MKGLRQVLRAAGIGVLGLLVFWGVTLGAWLATLATIALCVVMIRPPRRGALVAAGLAGFVMTGGAAETLWRIDRIGQRAREGELTLRDQLAVYGFNVGFGLAAIPAGFRDFGAQTLALGVPWSSAGTCPPDRLAAYGSHLPRDGTPRLRRWRSSLPLRSPRIRHRLRRFAQTLPDPVSGATGQGGPWRIGPWSWQDYVAVDAPNRVPVALNTPMTRLSVTAEARDGRWRLDGTVDLPMAYPERSSAHVGGFTIEEGMWHDARSLLPPYCLEYRFSVWADDPRLVDPVATRGPFERTSTAVLRAIGARY